MTHPNEAPTPQAQAVERARLLALWREVCEASPAWKGADKGLLITEANLVRIGGAIEALANRPAEAASGVAVAWQVKSCDGDWIDLTGAQRADELRAKGREVRALGVIEAGPASVASGEEPHVASSQIAKRVLPPELERRALDFEVILARFHSAVWEAGADEDGRTDYDMAGIDEAKIICGLYRRLLSESRASASVATAEPCQWCCGTGKFSDHACRFCNGAATPAASVAGVAGAVGVADSEIKALYVEWHGSDAGWLGIQGSYFISGVQAERSALAKAASTRAGE